MTTDIPDSFLLSIKVIDDILASPDSFSAERLMQRYEAANDKIAFVAALIGKVMLSRHRGNHA
jgi:hypothetical protein